ncbi:MAG: DUF1844 domain-containing protein [Deltaproteobacteria bacterium]|jgi:hypothetical protein|nr:DUF1844 domain-containing protein [Deltaproteobacteria bacterium]
MSDIKVNDRRAFAADGSLNPQREEEKEAPPEPQAADTAAPPEPELPEGYEKGAANIPATITTIFIGLASTALTLMGERGPQGESGREPNLPEAKHYIDLLGVLEKKTAGNLSVEEEAILKAFLYDLRLKYVSLSQGK